MKASCPDKKTGFESKTADTIGKILNTLFGLLKIEINASIILKITDIFMFLILNIKNQLKLNPILRGDLSLLDKNSSQFLGE